jgi:hypothetical protein
VPLFTNQITARIAEGTADAAAAVASIHLLAIVEILCVVLGIAIVMFLPKGRNTEWARPFLPNYAFNQVKL